MKPLSKKFRRRHPQPEETQVVDTAMVAEPEKIETPPELPIQHDEIASTSVHEEVKHDGESRPAFRQEHRAPVARFRFYNAAIILAIAVLLVIVGALVRARLTAEKLTPLVTSRKRSVRKPRS